jgi:hypothetical protein
MNSIAKAHDITHTLPMLWVDKFDVANCPTRSIISSASTMRKRNSPRSSARSGS